MTFRGYAKILRLALERENARKDGDYKRSDAIREELTGLGAQLDDKQHSFTTRDGHVGYYLLQRGVSYQEVQLCCLDREEARRDNDYRSSDEIRDYLVELGVQVHDKSHTFTTAAGEQGSYDLAFAVAGAMRDSVQQQWPRASPPVSHYASAPAIGGPHGNGHPGGHGPAAMWGGAPAYGFGGGRFPAAGYYQNPAPAAYGYGGGGYAFAANYAPVAYGHRGCGASYGWCGSGGRQNYGCGSGGGANDRHGSHQGSFDQRLVQAAARAPQPVAAARAPPAAAAAPAPVKEVGGGSGEDRFKGYHAILMLAFQREEARKANDYATADSLRNDLRHLGAEANDKTKFFTIGSSGLQGTYDLNVGVTAREVQMVALEREEARRGKDYAMGDRLRAWLVDEHAVQLDDKAHVFRMKDGTEGSFDLYRWRPVWTSEADAGGCGNGYGEPPPKRLGAHGLGRR